jgi:hypothetical protein
MPEAAGKLSMNAGTAGGSKKTFLAKYAKYRQERQENQEGPTASRQPQ